MAALVRRCKELQAALIECTEKLSQAQLSVEGLKHANAKVAEASKVRGG